MTPSDHPQAGLSQVEAPPFRTSPPWGLPGSRGRREGPPWSLLASFVVHCVIGFVVVQFAPRLPKPTPADVDSIAVEIIAPRGTNPAAPPSVTTEQVAPVGETPTVQQEKTDKTPADHVARGGEGPVEPSQMVTASQLYTEKMLASPKNKKVRQALRKLATEEHLIQLCNLEAMEQVHRWDTTFRPDYVVAYAMSDPKIAPTAIDAEGGAFRSGRRWYKIRFQCSVTADISKVVAFAFAVGNEIPEREWRGRNLAPDDGPDD